MTAVLREATLKAEKPSSPLASFPALFKQALSLGILSRRRVLQRVAAYQVFNQVVDSVPGLQTGKENVSIVRIVKIIRRTLSL